MTEDFKARAQRVRETVDLVELVGADGVELRREGALHKGLCPFHSETTPSFAVYSDGGYKCHGCGVWGDAITYVSERQGVSRLRALEILEGDTTPRLTAPRASAAAAKRRRYQPIMPIPDKAPRLIGEAWIALAQAKLTPTAVWWYTSPTGTRLMADARYEYPHPTEARTKKEVRTWCWARDEEDGSEHWAQTRPSDRVPLYGLDGLIERDADLVVICEGAKKADAIRRWTPHLGVSWCGGCEAVRKADWSPLAGRRCLIWPDHDKVGVAAAAELLDELTAIGAEVVGLVDLRGRQPALPESFDAADCADGAECLGLLERVSVPTTATLAGMFAAYPGDLDRPAQKKAERLGLLTAPDEPPPDEPPADEPPPDEPPDAPPPDEPPHDPDLERADIANASAFVDQHRHRVRYCADLDRWHVWDGVCWAVAAAEKNTAIPGAVMRLAEQTALRLAARHAELAKALRREAADLQALAAKDETPASEKIALAGQVDAKRKAARREDSQAEAVQKRRCMQDFVLLASCRDTIAIRASDLDRHDYLLNARNGTIDLRDGRLYAHDRAHLITRCCAVDYDPNARSTALDRVIAHVTNQDAEVAAYAQAILGHSLFGHNDLEQVYLWWGPGGSGKGTLMEALKHALGDYALKAEFQSFIKTPGARVRDDLDRLKEARVVLASEVDHGEEIAAAVLKEMSGGDTIASRQLYGSYKEFRPRMTLHLQANERPRVDDRDSGIWRRLVCIPCGPTVPADQRDPHLKTELRNPDGGARAVLAWLVAGAVRTHAAKFIPLPPAVESATRLYRQSNNPLADFLRERVRLAALDQDRDLTWCTSDSLHQELKTFYDLQATPPRGRMSPKRFRERLADWGLTYRRALRDGANTQHYFGLALASADRNATSARIPSPEEHEQALAQLEAGAFQLSTFPHSQETPHARAHAHGYMCELSKSHGNMETWKVGSGDEPPPDLTDAAFDPDRGASS